MGGFTFPGTATNDIGTNGESSNMKFGFADDRGQMGSFPFVSYCNHRHSNERGRFKYEIWVC